MLLPDEELELEELELDELELEEPEELEPEDPELPELKISLSTFPELRSLVVLFLGSVVLLLEFVVEVLLPQFPVFALPVLLFCCAGV